MTPSRRFPARPAAALSLLATALALAACASDPVVPVRPDPPRTSGLMVGNGSRCLHQNEAVEIDIGYCQAVRIGRTVHISGVVAAGPMDQAVPKAYAALGKVLAANGLGFDDVVKETVYTTDLDAFIARKDGRKAFYGEHLPAATWVQVQRLYLPAFVLEVEVTAEAKS